MSGLRFVDSKGKAEKNKIDSYKMVDGENRVRFFGNVLARYVYWLKGENNKDIPFECLSFNRNTEKWDNVEVDWVKRYYPDLKPSWNYSILCLHNGEVKLFNLKTKLMNQILDAAKDLELDPTDPDTGFDIVFDKKKTGPAVMNVEYVLRVLKLKSRALTEDERALIDAAKPIEEIMPRPTAEQQKELLDKLRGDTGESPEDDEVAEEFETK